MMGEQTGDARFAAGIAGVNIQPEIFRADEQQ
jgi:hypothetical protein